MNLVLWAKSVDMTVVVALFYEKNDSALRHEIEFISRWSRL